MEAVLLFLGKYEIIIYLLLLLASLIVFRWLWRAWRAWRQAYFSLEREIAQRHLAQAVIFSVLILILACGQTIIGSFIVPGLPASARLGTSTVDLLAVPGQNVSPESATMLALTPAIAAPVAGSEGCVPGEVEITSPKPGEAVSGVIEIIGTVNVPNFGFYKYEFASMGSELWATISADRKVKTNESLGSWATGTLMPGEYQLRLIVTDTQGQTLPACVISVRVVGQQ